MLLAFVPLFFAVASLTRATIVDAREQAARVVGRAIAAHVADVRTHGRDRRAPPSARGPRGTRRRRRRLRLRAGWGARRVRWVPSRRRCVARAKGDAGRRFGRGRTRHHGSFPRGGLARGRRERGDPGERRRGDGPRTAPRSVRRALHDRLRPCPARLRLFRADAPHRPACRAPGRGGQSRRERRADASRSAERSPGAGRARRKRPGHGGEAHRGGGDAHPQGGGAQGDDPTPHRHASSARAERTDGQCGPARGGPGARDRKPHRGLDGYGGSPPRRRDRQGAGEGFPAAHATRDRSHSPRRARLARLRAAGGPLGRRRRDPRAGGPRAVDPGRRVAGHAAEAVPFAAGRRGRRRRRCGCRCRHRG